MKFPRLLPRTLLALVIVFGVTMVATATSTAWRIEANLTEQYEARGRAIAESIASSSVEVLLFRDVSTVQSMIDRFLEIQGASYVLVVDAKGEVLAHTFVPSVPPELTDPENLSNLATHRIRIPGKGEYLNMTSPILGGRIGYVHVGMDRELINAEIRSAVARQLGLLAGIFLLSLLCAYLLMKRIVQPLDRLTEHAKKLASGGSEVLSKTASMEGLVPIALRSDEVGHLAQAFQHMSSEVSRRELDLRQAHAELEVHVKELKRGRALLESVHRAQTQFILATDTRDIFGGLLDTLLKLTDSQFGFIFEMFYTPEGKPYLLARAITNLSWNDEAARMHQELLDGTRSFEKLQSLYGVVMTTGKAVIANDVGSDSRRGGTPSGHPELRAFLGLPLHSNSNEYVGVIGLANRAGGYSEEIIQYLEPMVAACANLIAARKLDQRRQKAESDLRAAHAELEHRVEERTQELAKANRALSTSNADLEQFAFAASHDLQEPLRAIAGYCQLLQRQYKGKLDARAEEFIKNAVEGVDRMYALIDDLLQYARVTRRGEAFQEVDFNLIVQEALARIKVAVAESGAVIDAKAMPTLRADKGQMIRLFQNLIGNSVKYRSTRPPEVRITTEDRPQEIQFAIKDNGIGIAPKYFERIFVIFQRLHTREEYPGTGIGLAVCKRIIERHGGRIWVESKEGEGTTFYFTVSKNLGEQP